MHAVCNVIMNRVAKQSWYGGTITDVCLKNVGDESGRYIYQFDCNDPDDPNFDQCNNVTLDDPQFVIAMNLALQAVAGTLPDITRGSLNYYSTIVSLPSWARGKTPALQIGNTVFFNNID